MSYSSWPSMRKYRISRDLSLLSSFTFYFSKVFLFYDMKNSVKFLIKISPQKGSPIHSSSLYGLCNCMTRCGGTPLQCTVARTKDALQLVFLSVDFFQTCRIVGFQRSHPRKRRSSNTRIDIRRVYILYCQPCTNSALRGWNMIVVVILLVSFFITCHMLCCCL